MNFLPNANIERNAAKRVTRYGIILSIVLISTLVVILTVRAEGPVPYRFSLVPASDTIAGCLKNAAGNVTVLPKEELQGVDTLDLKTQGLPPHTEFTVFLTESADSGFGAAEYIGDFTTNAEGKGSMRVDTIIEEAFASTVVNGVRVRKELNHIVIWFADPAADDFCFAPGTGPTTPFDGDGVAGGTALSSRNFLPNAPLP
jgi:hypothetical protein